MDRLPRTPGSYVLALHLPVTTAVRVGRLGLLEFASGWYAYVGSALGPGGLAGRIGHHLRPVRKPHWHIDYLRAVGEVMAVWAAQGTSSREHEWSSMMNAAPLAGIEVPGFGCSDCRCRSHLFYFEHWPGRDLIKQKLGVEAVWLRQSPNAAGPKYRIKQ